MADARASRMEASCYPVLVEIIRTSAVSSMNPDIPPVFQAVAPAHLYLPGMVCRNVPDNF